MTEYRLYGFAQSGNAFKIASMLTLCGADWDPVFIDFFAGGTFDPQYRAINEMGEVPVLEHHGRRDTQSGLILYDLAERFGCFQGETEEEKREVLRWILFDNHKVSGSVAPYRVMKRYMEQGDHPAAIFLRGVARAAFRTMNQRLAARPFIVGATPTIADISLSGYLFWGDEFGEDWTRYPHLAAWLDRIRALPRWKHPYELMPGHPLPAASSPAALRERLKGIWG